MSINGANRLGSNSLTELLVFGARAARAAVRFGVQAERILPNKRSPPRRKKNSGEFDKNSSNPESGKRIDLPGCARELTDAMESGAGIYRSEESLRANCDKIRELKKRFHQIELADHSLTFNTELTMALELEYYVRRGGGAWLTALWRAPSLAVPTSALITPSVTTSSS